MTIRIRYWLAAALWILSVESFSSACCGGGSTFPSMILSDDQFQWAFAAGWAKTIGDVSPQGTSVFRAAQDQEWTQTYQISASHLLSDRWQAGFSFPFSGRSRSTGATSVSDWGMGDASVTLGFEAWPEYSYSQWRPRGYGFFQITVPTGGNVYESSLPFNVDARGRGLFQFAGGAIFVKSWTSWDSSLRLGVARSLPRRFQSADGSRIAIHPGWDATVALGVGYSPSQTNWRLGFVVAPDSTGATNLARSKLLWTATAEIARTFHRQWTAALSYSDQTLLGPAQNTSLDRTLQLSVRFSHER
jgi:hypothetical protein